MDHGVDSSRFFGYGAASGEILMDDTPIAGPIRVIDLRSATMIRAR
jgi:hypothetical protein